MNALKKMAAITLVGLGAAALSILGAPPVLAQTVPVTAQVVCHGDSLTRGENASAGLGTATGTTYPAVLARTLGPAWRVTNVGTSGWTIDLLTGEASEKVDPLYDPQLTRNVLIIFAGTNDLGGARESAGTAFGKLTAYCRARKAAYPWRILVVTPPMAAYPRVYPADFDAQMVQYDALIRRNWRSFADGIVDVQADFRLGAPGAERSPAYFSSRDFTHLTDAGYAIVGRDAAAAVRGTSVTKRTKKAAVGQKQFPRFRAKMRQI